MTLPRKLLIVALCCAAAAWIAGPAGRLLVVLPLLLFGPGYLLERALPPAGPLALAVRPALWLGLSLSIIALLYQWATALGLALTLPVLAVLAFACGLGIVWRIWQDSTTDDRGPRTENREPRTDDQNSFTRSPAHLFTRSRRWSVVSGRWSIALLGVFALTLWTRFSQVENLALPLWVDSVHHALLVRVAAEQGQAPYSLQPYLPIDRLPYHWGYHVFQAAVTQLSGLPLAQAMLWAGQVVNALHVLSVAALAAYLWRQPLAGVVAGLVAGLLSIMPAYYVSWGRYTQLTGLLLLPPLVIAWHNGLRTPSRRMLITMAVLLSGLILIHFRILIFVFCFIAVSGAVWAMRAGWRQLWSRMWYGAAIGGLTLVLAAPWIWTIALRRVAGVVAQPGSMVGSSGYGALNEGLLWAGHSRMLVALALVAALWGLRRRVLVVVEQVGWVGALAVLANPWLVGYLIPAAGLIIALWGLERRRLLVVVAGGALLLVNPLVVQIPYFWLITNDVVIISLFIPVSVLVGGGACLLLGWAERRQPAAGEQVLPDDHLRAGEPVLGFVSLPARRLPLGKWRGLIVRGGGAVLLVALALWGAWGLRSVINPVTILAQPADLAAITWVAEHTPPDARFLINAVGWLPDAERATDGGWWLLPLAGRWVSTPPVLFIYGSPDYVREAHAITRRVAAFQPGQEQQLYDLIKQQRITYIYLGPQPGPITPAVFAGNPAFEKVYERDGVTILAVHL